jgi:hypothetical protein
MTRLFYLVLAGALSFVPLMAVWAAERPPSASSTRTTGYGHSGPSFIYFGGGGRGGWLTNSYGWGNGSIGSGGSSSYRGGGPGGGGK